MISPQATGSRRLRSVDAYRGFVMLAMASGGIATFGCLSTGERRRPSTRSAPGTLPSSSTTWNGAAACSGT